jgi:hypothetical protein
MITPPLPLQLQQLAIENLALRQPSVYKRTTTRPKLGTIGRLFWVGPPVNAEIKAFVTRMATSRLSPPRP